MVLNLLDVGVGAFMSGAIAAKIITRKYIVYILFQLRKRKDIEQLNSIMTTKNKIRYEIAELNERKENRAKKLFKHKEEIGQSRR